MINNNEIITKRISIEKENDKYVEILSILNMNEN